MMKKLSLTPACLPGPQLQDTEVDGQLAGFGNYYRKLCLTDSHGPMKYHYCQGKSLCAFKKNCKPFFFDGIKNQTGCVKDSRTPGKWSRICSRFFFHSGYKFPSNINEVHLMYISKKVPGQARFLESCFRQDAGEHGWCRTRGNFYKGGEHDKATRIATDWGWGICSEECNQV